MPTILTGFLSSNLLPIGEDDEKLLLLENAAGKLADQIDAKPILAYRIAMVGLDDRVPATDPVHDMASRAIANEWQTMTNKTGAAPVQVHRAVMLRAIERAATKNPQLRLAMTLIARNQPPTASFGKAGDAIDEMLQAWEPSIAEELNEAWVNPVDMSFPKLAAPLKKPQVGKEDLAAALGRATGPTDKDGKPLERANPQWPNSGQPWAHEFVGLATAGIYAAIQAGTERYVQDTQAALRETLNSWASSLTRLTMRDAKGELLWLRTSKYSPSARKGFLSMNPNEIVIHAVVDISRTVTRLAPPSVEFFLRDLVAGFAPGRARLAEVISAISPIIASWPEGQSISILEQLPANGRRSWLDYAVRGTGAGPFEEQMGVPADYDDQLAEIAVQLYRELQIRKLLTLVS